MPLLGKAQSFSNYDGESSEKGVILFDLENFSGDYYEAKVTWSNVPESIDCKSIFLQPGYSCVLTAADSTEFRVKHSMASLPNKNWKIVNARKELIAEETNYKVMLRWIRKNEIDRPSMEICLPKGVHTIPYLATLTARHGSYLIFYDPLFNYKKRSENVIEVSKASEVRIFAEKKYKGTPCDMPTGTYQGSACNSPNRFPEMSLERIKSIYIPSGQAITVYMKWQLGGGELPVNITKSIKDINNSLLRDYAHTDGNNVAKDIKKIIVH